MGPVFASAMAGATSAHQAATATHEETSHQRADRTRRTSADPQRAQQGATAAPAAAPAALDSLSRLQQLADASPQVAQLRRLQALADGRFAPVAQLAGGPEEEELVQGKFASAELQPQLQQAPHTNNTGLPDQLKSGIESLSGLSMDHVRVHYNSAQPAQLGAHAYAQGSEIHVALGQERHLPHEAWHVVQQAQGQVQPTLQLKDGVQVNDDVGLEREADVMGSKALKLGHRADATYRFISMPMEAVQHIDGDITNRPDGDVANNLSSPLAYSRGSAQRGGNEMQRIADQPPEAALQRQVQAWGDGSERVGQLRAWQGVADGRGVGGIRQVLTLGLAGSQHVPKTGIASLSGMSMGGRDKPTIPTKQSVALNDDASLEKEADVIRATLQGKFPAPPPRQLGMGASSVVQRAWLGTGFPKTWDAPLDGVQWYMEHDGTIWYEPGRDANRDFKHYAGRVQKRTHDQWDELEIQLDTLSKAERRIGEYRGQKKASLNPKEQKKFALTGGVEAVRGEARTPVLSKDLEAPVEKTNWVQIDDDLGAIKDDEERKVSEKSDRKNTKFINMFHLPCADGDADAVVMMENFRESARPFFASDAFFDQWMRVQKITSLSDLPSTFPPIFYRNNISNEKLASMLNAALKGADQVDVDLNSKLFAELRATDNVKSTDNILREYNNINALRGEAPSRITSMRIYKGPAIRFTIEKKE
jgi:hypothetical protein